MGDWRYFLYDERQHEKKLIHYHYNKQTDDRLLGSKTVIFLANGFCNHAGLCDRLKGITTLYEWCKEYHLNFCVSHTHPFNLGDYLIPNQYDWYIDKKDICYNKGYTSVNHLMLNNLVRNLINSREVVSLQKKWFINRVNTRKKQLHFYTNMMPESNLQFSTCFQELFKPSPRLEKKLNFHLKSIGGHYISISFRFVQLLGDFIDCDGITLSEEEQENIINKSIKAIKEIKKENSLFSKILITSDSTKFIERAKSLPYVYVVEGKIGHINFEYSDDVNMKTFIDFLMIANAQKVYLAKSDLMYNSDFSRYAAMIHNVPFKIHHY